MHSQSAYNQIDERTEKIRTSLLKKAIKGQAKTLQAGLNTLERRTSRGTITHEWITRNITAHCRWGTRTAARRLAWDYYSLHVEMWGMMDDDAE